MSFEEQLVKELNELRTNPKGYAAKLNKYVSYFKGKVLRIPGQKAGIRTEEGADAFKETIDFLSKQKPIDEQIPSKGLGRIAKDFLVEVQKVDPEKLGEIDIDSIIAKYGEFSGNLSRAMDFGGDSPEMVIVNLVVSDGDPNRSQRESLLSTDLKRIGVATGKHDAYGQCTIIVSSTKFKNKVDTDDLGFIGGGTSFSAPKTEPKPEPKKEPKYETKKPVNQDEGQGQGKTLKPRKVQLKKPPSPKKEEPKKYEEEDDDDEIPPEDVISETRTEKIVVKNGKKKRVTKITRTMVDGTKNTETIVENVSDDE